MLWNGIYNNKNIVSFLKIQRSEFADFKSEVEIKILNKYCYDKILVSPD
jgi:hypothetical protein